MIHLFDNKHNSIKENIMMLKISNDDIALTFSQLSKHVILLIELNILTPTHLSQNNYTETQRDTITLIVNHNINIISPTHQHNLLYTVGKYIQLPHDTPHAYEIKTLAKILK